MPTSLDQLDIRPGTRGDYAALKVHHYRAGDPATMTRILAIDDATPTASDRFLRRRPAARPIAVLVESLPTLSCRARESALGGRYGHLRPGPRAKLLNEELRCISRVIVDPRYRGMGLAVGLVRCALSRATTRYTEALAVMGRVSPFFARAGMVAYDRPAHEAEQRAMAALHYAGIAPRELALPTQLADRIAALPPMTQRLIQRELVRWYHRTAGRGRTGPASLREQLDTACQRLLNRPVYYLHERGARGPQCANDT